jgi:hypothetical protein
MARYALRYEGDKRPAHYALDRWMANQYRDDMLQANPDKVVLVEDSKRETTERWAN